MESLLLRRTLIGHTGPVSATAVSPDWAFVVSASEDGTLKVWDAASGKELHTLEGHKGAVYGCAVSPDAAFVVSAGADGTLKVWDTATAREIHTLEGHTDAVCGCALSPDAAIIISASADQTLRLWDSRTGTPGPILEGHTDGVRGCAFSPDGALLASASHDRTLRLWDARTGAHGPILEGHTDTVNWCAFSPDGALLASAGSDRTVRLWDARTGAHGPILEGHTGAVYSCVVSPDGAFVASASADHTLKIWDSATASERATLTGHTGPVFACGISRDGTLIVSGSGDGTVRLWGLPPADLSARLRDNDPEAWAEVDSRVRAIAKSRGVPEGRLDDVALEVLARMLERRDELSDDSSINRLMVDLARRVSFDHLRADHLFGDPVALEDQADEGEPFPSAIDAESIAHHAEALRALTVARALQHAREAFDDPVEQARALRKLAAAAEAAGESEAALVISAAAERTNAVGAVAEKASPEPYLDQNVQFTVYRPQAIVPERWYDLLAFAHLSDLPPDAEEHEPHPLAEVQRQARQVLGEDMSEYAPVTQDSVEAVPRSGELTFVPEIEGIEFNPPRRSFLWLESVHREEFRLWAGVNVDGQTLRGRLTVFLGSVILADIPLTIRVDSQYATEFAPIPMAVEKARPYRKIFASYSHEDSWIVEEFDGYARAFGDEYLCDVVTLRAGEVWSPRLEELIREADVFQLFWSWKSMDSPFVRQEWNHALTLERPHFIRPVYWDEPLPVREEVDLPPEALRRLHFQRIAASRSSERTEPPERSVVRSEGWPVESSGPRRRLPDWAVYNTGADSCKRWGGGGGGGSWGTPSASRELTRGTPALRAVFGVLAIAAAVVGGIMTYNRADSVWAAVFVGLIALQVVARAIPDVITDSAKVRHAVFRALGQVLAVAIFYFSYQAWETGWLSFLLGIVGGAILRVILAPLLVFCLFPATHRTRS